MAFAEPAVTGAWSDLARDAVEVAAPVCSPAAPAIAHTLVGTFEGLAALEAEWNGLFARAGHSAQVFQQFNWCHHWAGHFLPRGGGHCRLAIVAGRVEGRLVMLWPLVMTRRAGLKELSWLGEPVSQYGDVLVEDGPRRLALLREGWCFIMTRLRPDFARFNKTRADSAIAPLLAELGARQTQGMTAPYLDLKSAPSWADFEKRYGAKALKNRRRQYRRLEEQGAVSFTVCREGPEAAALAREAILMKRAWLDAKGLVSPSIASNTTLEFFPAVTADASRPVGARVFALTCGAERAAIGIGFACGERIAVHVIVYAMAFEKAAAGTLLLERSMRDCLEAGIGVYDMLAPGGGYKTEWADRNVGVGDHALGLTTAGRLYVRGYLELARPRLKSLVIKLSARQRACRKALGRLLAPRANRIEIPPAD